MLVRFDSLGAFAKRAAEVPDTSRQWGRPSWYGDIDYATAVDRAIHGDNSLVSQAMAILDQLEASLETSQGQWASSPIGAYPIVPEFIIGLPDCMRRRIEVTNDVAPISVYVSTTCSAELDADTMLQRGIAILALVLKLQAIRPVRLFLLAETHGNTDGEVLQAIEINSQPLDLATICYAITHVGFARHLTYSLAKELDGFNGSWPNSYAGGGAPWEAHIREVLEMADQDLYIGAARSWDPIIRDSITWVNQQVAKACNFEGGN